jgi:multicomponent Na+:H+ antiporter subunit D
MLTQHLAILAVLLPLLAAPLCFLLGRHVIVWVFATLVSWLAFVVSLLLVEQVMFTATISYALGGWPAPWGIEVRIDALSAFVLLVVNGISSVVLTSARLSVDNEIAKPLQGLYYTAHLLCVCGLNGILITGDAFNLFVFLEISSLATYTLVSLASDRRSLTAAFRYLVMGTIGATFILIGVGMLYMKTGTLNMLDLAERIAAYEQSRTINTGLAFIMVGVSIKLALFPLHLWLPQAYTFAPSVVSSFLAGTATKVAAYVMLRFIFTVFGAHYIFEEMGMAIILLLLSVMAIFAGSIIAIFQHNVKTMLAYSSVAQIAYIVLGISLASVSGVMAGILHIFNHALMKTALFMALAAIFYRLGTLETKAFKGLAKQIPWTMAGFTLAGLSIIGVPLTAGFVSKWYLVSAALEQNNWFVAAVVLLGSLFALVYMGRIIEAAYFQSADESVLKIKKIEEAPLSLLLPLWLLVLANLYFGIFPQVPVALANEAANVLLNTQVLINAGAGQ